MSVVVPFLYTLAYLVLFPLLDSGKSDIQLFLVQGEK